MWEREIFDTDLYHLVGAFIIYSMLGWLVESIYMSFCNRKITNRGFGRGPFCPIYGVGAMVGYIILSPLKGNYLGIYIVGAASATLFEYIVGVHFGGIIMINRLTIKGLSALKVRLPGDFTPLV